MKTPQELTREQLELVVQRVQEILYWDSDFTTNDGWNPDKSWDTDFLPMIAEVLATNDLTPNN